MKRLPADILGERPLTASDLEAVSGAAWVNETGVIQTSLHVEDDQLITQDVMSGEMVDRIIEHVSAAPALSDRKTQGHYAGSIPLPLYLSWQREWKYTGKLWGIPWQTFFARKFFDSDYNKFRVRS